MRLVASAASVCPPNVDSASEEVYQPKKQRQYSRDEDAACQREVESPVLSADLDIAGQLEQAQMAQKQQ